MRTTGDAQDVTLYHFPPSLCSQKVRLALCEKGVAWRSRLVNIGPPMENFEPWYARINPGLVVPTLDHGGRIVTDSARIVRYVDEHFAGAALMPADAEDKARVEALIDLQDGLKIREILYAPRRGLIGLLTRGAIDKKRAALQKHLQANPDLREAYEGRLDDLRTWKATSHDAAAVNNEVERIRSALTQLATGLREHAFAAGERYSLADVVWTVLLARCIFMGYRKWWTGELTPIEAYYRRMKARPSFDRADIWERAKPGVMLPLAWQVLKMRLGSGAAKRPAER